MEIKTINDLVCLVDRTTLEKFLYNAKSDTKDENGNILLADNITTIRKNSFKNVSTVESLIVTTKINLTIEELAFENCSKLNNIVLDMSGKCLTIQSEAFKSCNELDSIYIKAASKIIIEKDVFAQCYKLRVVILEYGNVEIRDNAFESSNDLCIISKSNKKRNKK